MGRVTSHALSSSMIARVTSQLRNNQERATSCSLKFHILSSTFFSFLVANQKFYKEHLDILFIYKIMTLRQKYSS